MRNPYAPPSPMLTVADRLPFGDLVRRWTVLISYMFLFAGPPLLVLLVRLLLIDSTNPSMTSPMVIAFGFVAPIFFVLAWVLFVFCYVTARPLPLRLFLILLLLLPILPKCLYVLPMVIPLTLQILREGTAVAPTWILLDYCIWMVLAVVVPIAFGRTVMTLLKPHHLG